MQLWRFCVGFLWSAVTLPAQPTAQEQPFVSARPENPVVEFGGSLILNCSTTCQTVSSGSLETNLEKEDVGEGPTWKAFRLVNISDWHFAAICFFDCKDDEDMKPRRVSFTVYRLPELVELDPVSVMEAGKEYPLTCRVSNVAPIRNLTVTFLRGGQNLHTQTFEKHMALEAGNVVANHTVTARPTDHREEISCCAALDLRPGGPLFKRASFNQTLIIMDNMGMIVAIASIIMLAITLVITGIYSCCIRKQ